MIPHSREKGKDFIFCKNVLVLLPPQSSAGPLRGSIEVWSVTSGEKMQVLDDIRVWDSVTTLGLDRQNVIATVGNLSSSGKYLASLVVHIQRDEQRGACRRNVLTLREIENKNPSFRMTIVHQLCKQQNPPFDTVMQPSLYLDDNYVIIFENKTVKVRSTETFQVLHSLFLDTYHPMDYSNGYLIARSDENRGVR